MSIQPMCSSADHELENFLGTVDMELAFHRMCKQENKCGFGLRGICCRLCSNGPCRITEKAERGVCGATADVIAARGFLRSVAAGCGAYLHVTENAAKKLRKIASEKGEIRGAAHLDSLAKKFGITEGSLHHKAALVATAVLNDLYRPSDEKMLLWELLAHDARRTVWRDLGVTPGGGKGESLDAIVKTGTNLNSDPIDMLLHCLRLGITTGYYGLMLANSLNDILMGEPQLHLEDSGFGVIDPGAVNILVIGHQIGAFREILQSLEDKNNEQLARSVGASRVSLVGSTCVGQDLRSRCLAQKGGFCGYAGNNFTTEAILLTGCIDLVVSEFNCTLPGIDKVCEKMNIPQICLDAAAKTARSMMTADPASTAEEVLRTAAESFKRRSQNVRENKNPMRSHGSRGTLTGISEVTLKNFLGGSWKPLTDLLAAGAIRGIAAVVGCSSLRTMGHDVFTADLTKRLIEKDILVLTAGCTSGGLANLGFMNPETASMAGGNLRLVCETLRIPPVLDLGPCLGIARIEIIASEIASDLKIDLPQLPVVISAPQWLEEQALADGAFALALGFPLHLGSAPFVTGSKLVLDVLTEKMQSLTGGQLIVEQDPQKAAELLENIIMVKRSNLSL
jgi:carbon-monoxide dehydrogenase catalytic subunit